MMEDIILDEISTYITSLPARRKTVAASSFRQLNHVPKYVKQ